MKRSRMLPLTMALLLSVSHGSQTAEENKAEETSITTLYQKAPTEEARDVTTTKFKRAGDTQAQLKTFGTISAPSTFGSFDTFGHFGSNSFHGFGSSSFDKHSFGTTSSFDTFGHHNAFEGWPYTSSLGHHGGHHGVTVAYTHHGGHHGGHHGRHHGGQHHHVAPVHVYAHHGGHHGGHHGNHHGGHHGHGGIDPLMLLLLSNRNNHGPQQDFVPNTCPLVLPGEEVLYICDTSGWLHYIKSKSNKVIPARPETNYCTEYVYITDTNSQIEQCTLNTSCSACRNQQGNQAVYFTEFPDCGACRPCAN